MSSSPDPSPARGLGAETCQLLLVSVATLRLHCSTCTGVAPPGSRPACRGLTERPHWLLPRTERGLHPLSGDTDRLSLLPLRPRGSTTIAGSRWLLCCHQAGFPSAPHAPAPPHLAGTHFPADQAPRVGDLPQLVVALFL